VAKQRSPVLGYNTNLKYRGLVFHVQTEDSGVANPHIFTHLFYEGTILASRKTVYEVSSTVETVKGLMQAQQKAVLKELKKSVHDDRIDQLLAGTAGLLPRGAVEEPAPKPAAPAPAPAPAPPPRPAPPVAAPPRQLTPHRGVMMSSPAVMVGRPSRTVGVPRTSATEQIAAQVAAQPPREPDRITPLLQPRLIALADAVAPRSAPVAVLARRIANLEYPALNALASALAEHALESAVVASHVQLLRVLGDPRASASEADRVAGMASAVALLEWYAATAR